MEGTVTVTVYCTLKNMFILYAKFTYILCSVLVCLCVYNFGHEERVITKHVISMTTTTKSGIKHPQIS
jgi:hypothetical protein